MAVAKIRGVEEQPRSRSEVAALVAARRALAGGRPRAVVLVEGLSDRCAVEALAERRGRDLRAERVSVVPIGGAQAIGQFLNLFGRAGLDVRLAGICDAGEEGDFRRGLEQAGLGLRLTRVEMERLGFFVCSADLEDELIRALGAAAVEPSLPLRATWDRFARSRGSRSGAVARRRSSCGASWAAAAAGRSATHGCSSRLSISARCRGRSMGRWHTCELR